MLGLGSGISSMISTLVALVLYDIAGLVLTKRLRCDSRQLTLCHASTSVLKRPSDLNRFASTSPAIS